jgi:hypothetical protein
VESAEEPAEQRTALGSCAASAPRQQWRRRLFQHLEHAATYAADRGVRIVEQVHRRQRLSGQLVVRRKGAMAGRPRAAAPVSAKSIVRVVDAQPIELVLKRGECLERQVGIQHPGGLGIRLEQLIPTVGVCRAQTGAHHRRVVFQCLAQGWRHAAHQECRPSAQSRPQVDQRLVCQQSAGARHFFGPLQQPEAALRERLVTAGQADQRPRIARGEGTALAAAGHQLALHARAHHAHRT